MEALIQRGRPWHNFKEDIIDSVQNFVLSERFGWTPKQIEELENEERQRYIALLKGQSLAKPREK